MCGGRRTRAERVGRVVGGALQAIALGFLLALACIQLFCMAGGIEVFRYQGF